MSQSEKPSAVTPRDLSRVVPDATALKALTHPVRLKMLGMLRIDGPATATQLAGLLGLNSGATSYHLRQLALHGFIEEAPGISRRDRVWRARHETTQVLSDVTDGDEMQAGLAFTQAALSWQVGQMQQALDEYPALSEPWRQASTASDFTIPLTPEQAKALTERMTELLFEVMRTAPKLGEPLPEGTVPFSVHLHAFPYPGRMPDPDDTR
ncbi:winged helix-turn-helix domain-containing protein [Devosia sp. 2618]|uniref:ArsR/SmtB family transcription factor n=1 Tax=Devosia sp. 2618 TaxID=3156454 RepID=UPI003396710F